MDPRSGPGLLALVGGNEFHAGHEDTDRRLAEAAGPGPAYVVPTAAVRHDPEALVRLAKEWFAQFGLAVESLPVMTPALARSPDLARRAESAGFVYLMGGDPGRLVQVLAGSPVWAAIRSAWTRGAVLAGSSAGAMALGSSTLVRRRWPGETARRHQPALGVVPRLAVLPHFDAFGHRWVPSARDASPRTHPLLVGIDEYTAALWSGLNGEGTGWTVTGRGRVTIVRASRQTVYSPGESPPLPRPRLESIPELGPTPGATSATGPRAGKP